MRQQASSPRLPGKGKDESTRETQIEFFQFFLPWAGFDLGTRQRNPKRDYEATTLPLRYLATVESELIKRLGWIDGSAAEIVRSISGFGMTGIYILYKSQT